MLILILCGHSLCGFYTPLPGSDPLPLGHMVLPALVGGAVGGGTPPGVLRAEGQP